MQEGSPSVFNAIPKLERTEKSGQSKLYGSHSTLWAKVRVLVIFGVVRSGPGMINHYHTRHYRYRCSKGEGGNVEIN